MGMSAGVQTVLRTHAPRGGLTLRHPRWADFDSWVELRRQNEDYLAPWEPAWSATHLSRHSYRARLGRMKKLVAQDSAFPFHVFLAGTEQLIGAVNLTHIERGVSQSAKLGYWIAQAQSGRGYGRTAVRAVCDFAFDKLDLHRVEAAVQPDNIASIRLLEAADFQFEGTARGMLKIAGQWQDHAIYARLRQD